MSDLTQLKEDVVTANKALARSGLVTLTWGNVSGIDRESGLVVIKPSGVPYEELTPNLLPVLSLEGEQVGGDLNPSSDTKTHLHLYREFDDVCGIVHTHSPSATAFSQAGRSLPCLGTTHADHFSGTVPLAPALTEEQIQKDYEHETGVSIVELFCELRLKPLEIPAVLLQHHAPFTWGKTPQKAVENAIALEMCCQMALASYALEPDLKAIPQYLCQKHHERKHGPNAYYGQGGK